MFETECYSINNIEIVKEFDICNKHLQVKFFFNSTLINGFLTKEVLLRSDSFFSECRKEEIFVNIDNKFNIVVKNKKVILAGVTNLNETETIKLNLTQNNTQNEFDTFDNMISNYDNDVKLNGLFCFVFCFFFWLFLS